MVDLHFPEKVPKIREDSGGIPNYTYTIYAKQQSSKITFSPVLMSKPPTSHSCQNATEVRS